MGLGLSGEAAEALISEIDAELEAFKSECIKSGINDKYLRAVNCALTLAGAKSNTAARAILAHDWDGNDFDVEPSGLSDAVAMLRDSAPYLFKSDTDSAEHYSFVGISPAEEADNEISLEDVTYSDYIRLYKKQ